MTVYSPVSTGCSWQCPWGSLSYTQGSPLANTDVCDPWTHLHYSGNSNVVFKSFGCFRSKSSAPPTVSQSMGVSRKLVFWSMHEEMYPRGSHTHLTLLVHGRGLSPSTTCVSKGIRTSMASSSFRWLPSLLFSKPAFSGDPPDHETWTFLGGNQNRPTSEMQSECCKIFSQASLWFKNPKPICSSDPCAAVTGGADAWIRDRMPLLRAPLLYRATHFLVFPRTWTLALGDKPLAVLTRGRQQMPWAPRRLNVTLANNFKKQIKCMKCFEFFQASRGGLCIINSYTNGGKWVVLLSPLYRWGRFSAWAWLAQDRHG